MKNYNMAYEYKDEVVSRFKKYNPIVHTNKEKDYDFLETENDSSIELKNGEESMFIDLEADISIYYDDWHDHFYYEDRNDYEYAMNYAEDILNNKKVLIIIYSNNKWYSSSCSNKLNFTKEQAIDYVKEQFKGHDYKEFIDAFKESGVNIKFIFWDRSKNYEFFLDKTNF